MLCLCGQSKTLTFHYDVVLNIDEIVPFCRRKEKIIKPLNNITVESLTLFPGLKCYHCESMNDPALCTTEIECTNRQVYNTYKNRKHV